MRRYTSHDDFGETHSAFTICSFWWAEALALMGRLDRAIEVFERITRHANPVGLFSEDIDPETGALLGNFPQAYTHVGLIHAAMTISELLEARDGRRARCHGTCELMARLILVSNRLPDHRGGQRGENVGVKRSAGGLATGLRGLHERSGGTWVGWPGRRVEARRGAPRENSTRASRSCAARPVYLTADEVSRYYDGFSNAVLWPLFHYLLDRIPPSSHEWDVYRSVNERFADAAARELPAGGSRLGARLPARRSCRTCSASASPARASASSSTSRFPPPRCCASCRGASRSSRACSAPTASGFHTFTYRSHFSSSVLRILGIPTQADSIYVDGREIRLGVFPIGVDAQAFGALAEGPGGARARWPSSARRRTGRRFSSASTGWTTRRGSRAASLAFERLLEREPQWRGKVRLVQVAVPSRDKVPSYQEFRRQVDELVGRINGAFSTVDWIPIHYVYRSLSERQVVALYRAADVMLVTPLRDGMNLVAKEFVTCRTDEDGVLVLSEFAGAAAEMGEALQINPYDIEAMAQAYSDALTMPDEERHVRMRALRQRIAARDVHHWARAFIDDLAEPVEPERARGRAARRARISTHWRHACGAPSGCSCCSTTTGRSSRSRVRPTWPHPTGSCATSSRR